MAFKMSPIGKRKCPYSPLQKRGLINPSPVKENGNVKTIKFKANENNYETIKFSNSNLALYNDTEIDLTLSGNSLLRAGQTVNFMVQRNEPDSKLQSAASDFNPEKSGRYLISAIHHRFFLVTGTHKTYATLIRNFRGQAVPQQQEKVEIT